jgi:hypothetical protein
MSGAHYNGQARGELKDEAERLRGQFRRSQNGQGLFDFIDDVGIKGERYYRYPDGSWGDEQGKKVDPTKLLPDPEPTDFKLPSRDELKLTTLESWLNRDIPEADFLLGEVISTTSRCMLIGPTGLGKTNLGLAISWAIAEGKGFLHWRGSGRPCRVLYIDGEMSRRGMRKRLRDAKRRAESQQEQEISFEAVPAPGEPPETLFVLSHEDFPELSPLNGEAGQRYIDHVIDQLGGVDLVVFDNIQALTNGKLIEEDSWKDILLWVLDLTRREIGQLWIHHTGYDESHGYGTSTREWRMDTVVLLEKLKEPPEGADLAFGVSFLKARERDGDNAADFEDVTLTLTNDTWTVVRDDDDQPDRGDDAKQRGGSKGARRAGRERRERRGSLEDLALEALETAIIEQGKPVTAKLVGKDRPCAELRIWRDYFRRVYVAGEGGQEVADKVFQGLANKLRVKHRTGIDGGLCWIVPNARSD